MLGRRTISACTLQNSHWLIIIIQAPFDYQKWCEGKVLTLLRILPSFFWSLLECSAAFHLAGVALTKLTWVMTSSLAAGFTRCQSHLNSIRWGFCIKIVSFKWNAKFTWSVEIFHLPIWDPLAFNNTSYLRIIFAKRSVLYHEESSLALAIIKVGDSLLQPDC